MTQPIDVAYVEVEARTKNFAKQLDKDVTQELKKVEKEADSAAEAIAKSFEDAGKSVGEVFKRDKNGRLRNSLGHFVAEGKQLGEEVGESISAGLETATASARGLGSALTSVLGSVGQLAAAGPAGIAILAGAFIALSGAVAVAAAAVQNLLVITGAVAAALPGAIFAAVAGFGVLAVALHGVSDAFKEQTEQANTAGAAAVNNSRQIADAQRGILQAQKDLIKAREDELERIQDIRRELIAARVSEKRAIDNVLKAEYALQQARRTGTPRAVIEAQLALEEANAELDAAKDKTQDLAKENAKADKVGVEGSDQVLRAKEALRDAEDRLAQLQQKVTAGAAAQKTAFDGLTKSAQAFVTALISAKEQLGPVADAIQEAFFKGTAPLIQPIVDNIKELQPELTALSSAFGGIFKELLEFLGEPVFKQALDDILTGLTDFLTAITPAVKPLLEAFAMLAGQSGEFGQVLGEKVAGALLKIADFIKNVDLKQLFTDAKAALDELVPLIEPLVSSTIDLFKVLAALGRLALPSVAAGFEIMARSFTFVEENIIPIIDKFTQFLNLLGTDTPAALDIFKGMLKDAINGAVLLFDKFAQGASETFERIGKFIKDLPGVIISLGPKILAAGQAFISKFFQGLSGGDGEGGFFSDVGKKIANSVIRFLNRNVIGNLNVAIQNIERGLNALPLIDGVDLPNFPSIPQLASGGVITQDGLFRGGEGGKEEGVLPLENPRAMAKVGNAIADAGGLGSGMINFSAGSITVVFENAVPTERQAYNTGRAVADGIAERLASRQLTTGVRTL